MPLLDPLTKLAPSATAAGPAGAQRLDVVWADVQPGSGGTGPLFHKYYLCETGQWFPLDGGWYSRGGEWSSAVTIDAFSDGRVEAFGLGPDGGLQHYSALGDLLNGPGEWIPDQLGTPPGQLIVCSPATTVLSPTQPTAVVRTAEAVTGRLGWWFDSLDALPATPSDPFGFAWTWAPYAQSTSPFWPALNPSFATGPALVWRYNGDFDLFVVNDAA